ncbi:MAG: hypothetical protein U1E93_02010 [Alphaproteobacteria bacterium]
MADNTPVEVTGPQVLPATNVAINMTAAGIAVSFGTLRPLFTGPKAHPPSIEWLVSVAMSATTAEQLYLALESAVKEYEKRFGKVPKDPAAKMETLEASADGKQKTTPG